MFEDQFVRKATLLKIVDADTIDVSVDLGFDTSLKLRLRLAGMDAPERYTVSGKAATKALEGLLKIGSTITVKTYKDKKEKYGRYLADVFREDETTSVNNMMLELGQAVPYDGGARK